MDTRSWSSLSWSLYIIGDGAELISMTRSESWWSWAGWSWPVTGTAASDCGVDKRGNLWAKVPFLFTKARWWWSSGCYSCGSRVVHNTVIVVINNDCFPNDRLKRLAECTWTRPLTKVLVLWDSISSLPAGMARWLWLRWWSSSERGLKADCDGDLLVIVMSTAADFKARLAPKTNVFKMKVLKYSKGTPP